MKGDLSFELVMRPSLFGIQKSDPSMFCHHHPVVPGREWSHLFLTEQRDLIEIFGNLAAGVFGTVVYHNDLIRLMRLLQNGADRSCQGGDIIMCRDDDRDLHRLLPDLEFVVEAVTFYRDEARVFDLLDKLLQL